MALPGSPSPFSRSQNCLAIPLSLSTSLRGQKTFLRYIRGLGQFRVAREFAKKVFRFSKTAWVAICIARCNFGEKILAEWFICWSFKSFALEKSELMASEKSKIGFLSLLLWKDRRGSRGSFPIRHQNGGIDSAKKLRNATICPKEQQWWGVGCIPNPTTANLKRNRKIATLPRICCDSGAPPIEIVRFGIGVHPIHHPNKLHWTGLVS